PMLRIDPDYTAEAESLLRRWNNCSRLKKVTRGSSNHVVEYSGPALPACLIYRPDCRAIVRQLHRTRLGADDGLSANVHGIFHSSSSPPQPRRLQNSG